MTTMEIWCVECGGDVPAHLTTGAEIYPHRPDLSSLPFWRCPSCDNWVGCHHKTANPTTPLGVIPTPELRQLRQRIHRLLDRINLPRDTIYATLSSVLGRSYHTADLRSPAEATLIHNYLTLTLTKASA